MDSIKILYPGCEDCLFIDIGKIEAIEILIMERGNKAMVSLYTSYTRFPIIYDLKNKQQQKAFEKMRSWIQTFKPRLII